MNVFDTETRGYNASGQLTSLALSAAVSPQAVNGALQYVYSITLSNGQVVNNGQISQVVDSVSGETVTYQYDALKRLTSASSAAWNQAYQYDGFGSLTAKGAASIPVDATTNRLSNAFYDANGNMTSGSGVTLTYDEANRVASATPLSGGTEYYTYAPDGKRIFEVKADGTEEWTLYGARGEKLGVYGVNQ